MFYFRSFFLLQQIPAFSHSLENHRHYWVDLWLFNSRVSSSKHLLQHCEEQFKVFVGKAHSVYKHAVKVKKNLTLINVITLYELSSTLFFMLTILKSTYTKTHIIVLVLFMCFVAGIMFCQCTWQSRSTLQYYLFILHGKPNCPIV